jgi:chaperone required for assembly of F1-ATPase
MRDFLEDAEGAAERGDVGPGKANRGLDKPHFPKRFYKSVAVHADDNQFLVLLDDRPVKTPGRNPLSMPSEASAKLVADEWEGVDTEINPMKMPVTRLANTAIDGVSTEAQAVMEDIVRYASSDLLCYRADGPEGLIETQREHWDPILDWVDETHGARFSLIEGIMHHAQPKDAIAAYGNALKKHADPFQLAALHTFTSLSGSALIALALEH